MIKCSIVIRELQLQGSVVLLYNIIMVIAFPHVICTKIQKNFLSISAAVIGVRLHWMVALTCAIMAVYIMILK